MIYFDAAATTLQKPPQVKKALLYAMDHYASPGRGGHRPAMLASDAVYACRQELAALFEAKPEDIVFTMNATHALNLAIRSLVSAGDEVVISGFEHNAVWRPLNQIGADVRIAGRRLFDPDDTIEGFRAAITENTKAVVCTHVSNVFGYVLPVEEIAALCREREVPLILDCSQSAGILPVSLRKLPAAFLCMPGHKSLYGPQGTGVLVCGHALRPLLAGGTGSLSERAQMPGAFADCRARKDARAAFDCRAGSDAGRAGLSWSGADRRGVVSARTRGCGENRCQTFPAGLCASRGASLRAAGARVGRDAAIRHRSRQFFRFQHRTRGARACPRPVLLRELHFFRFATCTARRFGV